MEVGVVNELMKLIDIEDQIAATKDRIDTNTEQSSGLKEEVGYLALEITELKRHIKKLKEWRASLESELRIEASK